MSNIAALGNKLIFLDPAVSPAGQPEIQPSKAWVKIGACVAGVFFSIALIALMGGFGTAGLLQNAGLTQLPQWFINQITLISNASLYVMAVMASLVGIVGFAISSYVLYKIHQENNKLPDEEIDHEIVQVMDAALKEAKTFCYYQDHFEAEYGKPIDQNRNQFTFTIRDENNNLQGIPTKINKTTLDQYVEFYQNESYHELKYEDIFLGNNSRPIKSDPEFIRKVMKDLKKPMTATSITNENGTFKMAFRHQKAALSGTDDISEVQKECLIAILKKKGYTFPQTEKQANEQAQLDEGLFSFVMEPIKNVTDTIAKNLQELEDLQPQNKTQAKNKEGGEKDLRQQQARIEAMTQEIQQNEAYLVSKTSMDDWTWILVMYKDKNGNIQMTSRYVNKIEEEGLSRHFKRIDYARLPDLLHHLSDLRY